MVKVIEIYENKSKNCESFGQGLDNNNMISLKKMNVNYYNLGPHQHICKNQVFPTQMKVKFRVLDRIGG